MFVFVWSHLSVTAGTICLPAQHFALTRLFGGWLLGGCTKGGGWRIVVLTRLLTVAAAHQQTMARDTHVKGCPVVHGNER